jgi:hypothetical protein
MSGDTTVLELINDLLVHFHETLESRPLMLGNAEEVNAMFYLVDRIEFIIKYKIPMDYGKFGWMAFLIDKGYIKGARDTFGEKLKEDNTNFDELKNLRKEYATWLAAKLPQ